MTQGNRRGKQQDMASKHTVINRPVARSERLIVEQVGDEAVIFDLETRASHALKPLAAAVYTYADGKNTVVEIAELASHRLAQQVTEADAADAVVQLTALNLLEAPEVELGGNGLSRRDALKTFAAVGASAALVSTVTAGAAMAATNQTSLGDDQTCGQGYGGAMVPSAGQYANYVFPLPGVVQPFTVGSSKYGTKSFTGLAGGASYGYGGNDNAVNPAVYDTACNYIAYTGTLTGGADNGNNYVETAGVWQCIPCDGALSPGYQCCQVVCGPTPVGTEGYGWGKTASPPPGYSHPYTGCGTDNTTSCPDLGQPDYTSLGYYGKYCTNDGGKPTS